MKKIVGGLLVMTLLSRPSLLKIDFIAYEIYKSQQQLISMIKKDFEDEKDMQPEDVDKILGEIDQNSRSINRLLKSKYDNFGKIQLSMHLKSKTKAKMTDKQIYVYKEFSEFYNKELNNLNKNLSDIEHKLDLNSLQNMIISKEFNCNDVYKKLKAIKNKQFEAIYNLSEIIFRSQEVLAIL